MDASSFPRFRYLDASRRECALVFKGVAQAQLGDNKPTSGKSFGCQCLLQDFHFLDTIGVGMPEMHIELVKA
jgi:hypothetical protein